MGRRSANLKAVDGGAGVEQPDGQPVEQSDVQVAEQPADKPKRQRGPNKPPPTFLGGLRAQVEAHERRIAGLVERRKKALAELDAANLALEAEEAPLRDARAILDRYPELPGMDASSGPGTQPGRPPLPGDDDPRRDDEQNPPAPPAEPKQPQQPDGQPAGQPPEPKPAGE